MLAGGAVAQKRKTKSGGIENALFIVKDGQWDFGYEYEGRGVGSFINSLLNRSLAGRMCIVQQFYRDFFRKNTTHGSALKALCSSRDSTVRFAANLVANAVREELAPLIDGSDDDFNNMINVIVPIEAADHYGKQWSIQSIKGEEIFSPQ